MKPINEEFLSEVMTAIPTHTQKLNYVTTLIMWLNECSQKISNGITGYQAIDQVATIEEMLNFLNKNNWLNDWISRMPDTNDFKNSLDTEAPPETPIEEEPEME